MPPGCPRAAVRNPGVLNAISTSKGYLNWFPADGFQAETEGGLAGEVGH